MSQSTTARGKVRLAAQLGCLDCLPCNLARRLAGWLAGWLAGCLGPCCGGLPRLCLPTSCRLQSFSFSLAPRTLVSHRSPAPAACSSSPSPPHPLPPVSRGPSRCRRCSQPGRAGGGGAAGSGAGARPHGGGKCHLLPDTRHGGAAGGAAGSVPCCAALRCAALGCAGLCEC